MSAEWHDPSGIGDATVSVSVSSANSEDTLTSLPTSLSHEALTFQGIGSLGVAAEPDTEPDGLVLEACAVMADRRKRKRSSTGKDKRRHKSKVCPDYDATSQRKRYQTKVMEFIKSEMEMIATRENFAQVLKEKCPEFLLSEEDLKLKQDGRPYVQAQNLQSFELLFNEKKLLYEARVKQAGCYDCVDEGDTDASVDRATKVGLLRRLLDELRELRKENNAVRAELRELKNEHKKVHAEVRQLVKENQESHARIEMVQQQQQPPLPPTDLPLLFAGVQSWESEEAESCTGV